MTVDPGELRRFYETATLRRPENAIGFVLWRVAHRYQREAERVLGPLGLTHLQFTTLAMVGWLCRSGEAPTQATVAREAEIHPMQVSLMLKALETKRLVERARSADDPRAKRVTIRPEGLAALREAMPLVIDLQKWMFGDAGTPGETLIAELLDVENRLNGRPGGR